jgi:dTDP-4-dehydrorhamnose reductase
MARVHRVLLFGASGQLGAMVSSWKGVEIVAPSHAEVDLADVRNLEQTVQRAKPDVVINCAAYNDVPGAQSEPLAAFAINALAVGGLAQICAKAGCRFATVSTDYVFDGSLGRPYVESDAPAPINAYGASKLSGELFARSIYADSIIIRTCGLYGTRVSASKGHSFINTILTRARAGEELRVVDDQTVSPTYAGDLAAALRALLEMNAPPGVYHAVNEGACTWYEFAREVLAQARIEAPLRPIATDDAFSAVRRPRFSALANAKLQACGISLPSREQGIAAFLRDVRV